MTDRLQENTAAAVQAEISARTEEAVRTAALQGRIDERLAQLDQEWNVERALFTATGINGLLGLVLGTWVDRRWYAYVAGVAAFQFQHGVQGWCPPMAVVRRLKFRTSKEIQQERTALKALRGDFRDLPIDATAEEALAAARR